LPYCSHFVGAGGDGFNGRPIRLGREITWKEQEKGRFLFDVPTWKGLVGAGVAIVLFLAVAYFLYIAGGFRAQNRRQLGAGRVSQPSLCNLEGNH
jgi:hypothetical protein